tara:strand:- start:126 stop:476 length:351 start_codon:yes stop_codon:yes gene_type:complete
MWHIGATGGGGVHIIRYKGVPMTVNDARLRKILQQSQEAERLGIKVKYLCFSSACEHHRYLHGDILDIEQVKHIYHLENVPEDCCCGVAQIDVDDAGQPKNPRFVEEVKAQAKGWG